MCVGGGLSTDEGCHVTEKALFAKILSPVPNSKSWILKGTHCVSHYFLSSPSSCSVALGVVLSCHHRQARKMPSTGHF